MLKFIIKLTQLAVPVIFGALIVGLAVWDTELLGGCLVALVIDFIVGIILQYISDNFVDFNQSTGEDRRGERGYSAPGSYGKGHNGCSDSSAGSSPWEREGSSDKSGTRDTVGATGARPRRSREESQRTGGGFEDGSFGGGGLFGDDAKMDKDGFAELQRLVPGFSGLDYVDEDEYISLLAKFSDGEQLTVDEEARLALCELFGSFNGKRDVREAYEIAQRVLSRVFVEMPRVNDPLFVPKYQRWLHDFGIANILLGTVYAYLDKTVEACYYFMKGLDTESVNLNMPYCDFIKYILSLLPRYCEGDADYKGWGFSADKPMGSTWTGALMSWVAMDIIPVLEGRNGEVIVAKRGRSGMYGHLERRGSTKSESTTNLVDIYETYIIDKDMRVLKLRLYFNGYFDGQNMTVRIPSEFRIKAEQVSRIKRRYNIEIAPC